MKQVAINKISGNAFVEQLKDERQRKIAEQMADPSINGKIDAPSELEYDNVIAVVKLPTWTDLRKLKKRMIDSFGEVSYCVTTANLPHEGGWAVRPVTNWAANNDTVMYDVLLTTEEQLTFVSLFIDDSCYRNK